MKTTVLKEAHTAKMSMYMLRDNFLKVITHENAHLEIEDIKAIQRIRREMIGMKPYCILSMAEKYVTISQEAREWASTKENIDNRIALAIVVDNLAHRIIGNFFVKAHEPHTPAKIFGNEEDALKWVEQFLK